MKHITLLAVFLVAWLVVDRVLSGDSSSGRLLSLRDRWRAMRRKIHVAVGVVAALILIVSFLQLVLRSLARE